MKVPQITAIALQDQWFDRDIRAQFWRDAQAFWQTAEHFALRSLIQLRAHDLSLAQWQDLLQSRPSHLRSLRFGISLLKRRTVLISNKLLKHCGRTTSMLCIFLNELRLFRQICRRCGLRGWPFRDRATICKAFGRRLPAIFHGRGCRRCTGPLPSRTLPPSGLRRCRRLRTKYLIIFAHLAASMRKTPPPRWLPEPLAWSAIGRHGLARGKNFARQLRKRSAQPAHKSAVIAAGIDNRSALG